MNTIKKAIGKIKAGWLRELSVELGYINKYTLQHKYEVMVYLLIGVLSTVLSLGAALVSKHIIDAVTGKDSSAIVPAAFFYLTMQLLSIVFNAFSGRINAKIQIRVEQKIRSDVYDSIINASWLSLSSFRSGDLLARLESDVSTVSKSVLSLTCDLVTKLIRFVGALVIILYYDPALAVISLIAVPFTVLLSQLLLRKLRYFSIQTRKSSADLTSFNEESFSKLTEIKALGLSEVYRDKLRQEQDSYKKIYLKFINLSVNVTAFMSVTAAIISGLCFLWCVWRLWMGVMTFGTMTLFLQMSATLTGSFTAIVSTAPSVITSAACAGRIMAVTSLEKESTKGAELAESLSKSSDISIYAKSVDFSYDDTGPVFEGADFSAVKGETIGIVGASGEGKTTILRMLLGLVEISGGRLYISSSDGQTVDIDAGTRSLFAYVGQENVMFSGTVRENLLIVRPDASQQELYDVLRQACAYNFVMEKPDKLDTVIGDSAKSFSQGQLQRLSIARAILSGRPVILLDEATSALDEATEAELIRSVSDARHNRTIIVATHRQRILKLCDRVYKVSGHRLTEL